MLTDKACLEIAHALLDGYVQDGLFSAENIPLAAELVRNLARNDELRQEVERKGDLDYVALEKASVYWSTGRAISADDLLLKAMTNSLSGARKCPRDLPVKEFLIGAMRSLASSSYKGSKRDPLIIGRAVEDQEEEVSLAHGTAASSEDILIAEERQAAMRTALVNLFKDDPEADLVLTGLLQDMSREEIQKDCNLTDTEYETIRRRMRRTINKHYPKGCHDTQSNVC